MLLVQHPLLSLYRLYLLPLGCLPSTLISKRRRQVGRVGQRVWIKLKQMAPKLGRIKVLRNLLLKQRRAKFQMAHKKFEESRVIVKQWFRIVSGVCNVDGSIVRMANPLNSRSNVE
jgi:hypothetical protein